MKVKELIERLKKMPQEKEVWHLWDGEPRTVINIVYESKNGNVVTADNNMICYSNCARPKNAPTEEEDRHWRTDGEYQYIDFDKST